MIRYAFELARKRDKQRKVTVTCKYSMLAVADGLFLEMGKAIAKEYPEIAFNHCIIDDFLSRMITNPQALDVVVMPNLYGNIMSDGAAGLIGGLGLAPSGCYGEDYAYPANHTMDRGGAARLPAIPLRLQRVPWPRRQATALMGKAPRNCPFRRTVPPPWHRAF